MTTAFVMEDETPEMLSARLNRPICMVLRANRLFSAAWLLPGREIDVPDADFCVADEGVCPREALCTPARGGKETGE